MSKAPAARSFSLRQLATNSLRHHWRANLVLAIGIAAATAVLAGALIVGDSMRTSLRRLALDRLGEIDELIVSDGFFRQQLASEISELPEFEGSYRIAEPGILFPAGTVETGVGLAGVPTRRASGVNVFGVSKSFWKLAGNSIEPPDDWTGRSVVINQTLAEQIGVSEPDDRPAAAKLSLRIPKPTQLPSDSSLGRKDNLVESLIDLSIAAVIPDKGLGRFSLTPSQSDSPNLFVPLDLLSETLARGGLSYRSEPQANVIFLAGSPIRPPTDDASNRLLNALKPRLQDLGLSIRHVSQQQADSAKPVFEYYSISSDRLVLSDKVVTTISRAFPESVPVFTYLANRIRKTDAEDGIPFSMISAIEIGDGFPLADANGARIDTLKHGQIVLNQWAADDIGATVGDSIEVVWFEPESTHGSGAGESAKESSASFELVAIAGLTEPDSPFRVRGRRVDPAVFESQSPTLANDPYLTPEVPGLTDAASIEKWDLPFETPGIRAADDDYWNSYRTTPKAFVSLDQGQSLWASRFGTVTSMRIPIAAGKLDKVAERLESQFHSEGNLPGFTIVPLRRNAIEASSGSTPFDALFLALSMFVIAAALILVSLLFRLTLKTRATDIGTTLAAGFQRREVIAVILYEMLLVCIVGTVIGLAMGLAYAWLMIFGLRTWWLGAISKPVLELHVSPLTLVIGAACGLVVCLFTIALSIRSTRKTSVKSLLAGEVESDSNSQSGKKFWPQLVAATLLVSAVGLIWFGRTLGGEQQAGTFMGAGFALLAAALIQIFIFLRRPSSVARPVVSLQSLATNSTRRNPLRSTLTIALVAVASFLIVAVSSFRLTPTEEGTAGFDLIARSDRPIFDPLQQEDSAIERAFSLRWKSGEDASCNNLYQSTQPQVLGIPADMIDSFRGSDERFRWAAVFDPDVMADENRWTLLNQQFEDGAIPAVIDKNTANYSLKIFAVGEDFPVDFDSGESVLFRVVGFLENSILQGSLIVSEDHFTAAFPNISGYRQFLFSASQGSSSEAVAAIADRLESKFSDQGLDVQSTKTVLAQFQRVQNTYISTFQTLGALGLLLGTFGLAAVQIRSVLERQKELALMQSVGFSRRQLTKMVLLENVWLLLLGLATGIGAALVTTLPHYFFGGASVPWADLALLFLVILISGLVAAALGSRIIARLPLLQSLRV